MKCKGIYSCENKKIKKHTQEILKRIIQDIENND